MQELRGKDSRRVLYASSAGRWAELESGSIEEAAAVMEFSVTPGHRPNCVCNECCIRRTLLKFIDVPLSPEALHVKEKMRLEGWNGIPTGS